ncbi:MAG: FAD-dependent oxidoreductase [Acidobacteria bacterium]|jgi:protoporphyrinogen oxidase|nr:FAD-dependent oxidoreductase [Acidobacteriota bacterium]
MKFTRREILTAFLGLPFALSACKSNSETSSIDGEIVGASANIGHILRENRNVEVPANNWENLKVAIIGGGIAGLSAAWKFTRENFNDFVLLELESAIGGTARSGKNNFIGYPWGAHYLPVPFKENTELISLLDEMNLTEGKSQNGEILIKEQFLCREPEERVFYKGRWYEGLYLRVGASQEDLRQLNELNKQVDFWVNWRDTRGKRAFVLPIANCSNDAEVTDLDKITFADWLKQKGFTSERLIWYCNYACRDDYGLRLEQTSAWAGLFYFCSRVRKSGAESQSFITFPEGNGKFVNFLHNKVKDKTRLKSIAIEIIPNEKGIDITYLNTETNEIRGIHAEKVIFAAPIFTAKYLIRDFKQNTPDFVKEFEHNAWFVANLFLKDRPKNQFAKDFPLAWDNVLYESNSLGYVNATHQKGIDYGQAVFTYYFPMAEKGGRAKLFSLDWQELADIVLSDLSMAHKDIRALTERIDFMRWGHAMISPRRNFIWNGSREKATKPFRNIHFAHSDLSGIALFEEAFFHGLRTVSEILIAEPAGSGR